MKIILALAILGVIVFSTGVYGQTAGELAYRFLPDKIIENSSTVLQVYAKDDTFSRNVDNLIATSTDSSIIKILGVEKDENNFITDVKIMALNPGTTNIDLAAPGFTSQEIPITVYSDYDAPTKMLIKTTPSTFSTIGSLAGYVSVEFVNDAGVPIKSKQDTIVTLTTSNSDIVKLKNTELTIKKDQYYVTAQFEVKKDGIAQIFASASSLQTVSSTVTVSTSETSSSVKLYVFPKTLNTFQNSNGYVIAELQKNGIPVKATQDVTIPVQVTNASGMQMINSGTENPTVTANQPIMIKKGSYWGYTQISVVAGTKGWMAAPWGGLQGLWDVGINAKGYLISSPVQITTTLGPVFNDHTAILDLVPILATGQKELIGVIHLENNSLNYPGPPVIANHDFQVEVDSSDLNTLSVEPVQMSQGSGAGLVFAKVGSTVPVQPTLHVVTAGPQIIPQNYSAVVSVPASDSSTLVADSLIPNILTNNDFPLALYVTKSGAIDYFTKDLSPFVSPGDVFQTESTLIHSGDSIVLQNSKSLKDGTITLTAQAGDFSTNLSLQSLSSKPSIITVSYPEKILSNLKNTFSIQILDSNQNPVFANQDTQFKLVSSDPTILTVPENVVIKKGNYYSLFSVEAERTGMTELTVLSSDLPLSKFPISVTSLTPSVSLSSTDFINPNTNFDATVTAQYNGAPLSGLKVDWNVQGATTQNMESITNNDGHAIISLVSSDPSKVTIQATVSGGIYGVVAANKDVTVNPPLTPQSGSTSSAGTTGGFSIAGLNPLFIVIPVAVAVGGVVLKKKNMLDGISEKIGIMEKFTEVKERLTQSREK